MIQNELYRIATNFEGEQPPQTGIRLAIIGVDSAEVKLEQVKDIVGQYLISAETLKGADLEKQLFSSLPKWFINATGHNLEEVLARPGSWHFGSWVASMEDRCWTWYSSKLHGDEV